MDIYFGNDQSFQHVTINMICYACLLICKKLMMMWICFSLEKLQKKCGRKNSEKRKVIMGAFWRKEKSQIPYENLSLIFYNGKNCIIKKRQIFHIFWIEILFFFRILLMQNCFVSEEIMRDGGQGFLNSLNKLKLFFQQVS